MNAEFNWWLLIVGLVVGAGLVWYVLMDSRRRETDVADDERPREAAWLSATLADEGWDVPPEAAARLLELHRAYLDAPPPDAVPRPAFLAEELPLAATEEPAPIAAAEPVPAPIAAAVDEARPSDDGSFRAQDGSQPDLAASDTDLR